MKQLKVVDRSIVTLKRAINASVKEMNQQAAKLVARGRYDASTNTIEAARKIRQFVSEVDALRDRWKALKPKAGSAAAKDSTPLWEYYVLVARALVEIGGEGVRGDVIEWIGQNAISQLRPGDLAKTVQGRLVWQRRVAASKRPMVKEGYLEAGGGQHWKLTKLGRDIAKRGRIGQ